MIEARRFPSLKRWLWRVHRDLDKIVMPFDQEGIRDLCDLEVLIILLEDRRFFDHRGIDWRSIARETLKAIARQPHGGASTIDMQFVRTRTGYKQNTLGRKSYEMFLAFLMQYRMGKLAILRCYMQVMYLGSGINGVTEAASSVFQKELWELTRQESAFIAAMMVYPMPLSPTTRWRAAVERRTAYGLKLFDLYGNRYKQRFEQEPS
jgi:membrane peptidoglycan carboxypeptidase